MNEPASPDVVEFLKLGALRSGVRTERGWQLAGGLELVCPEPWPMARRGPVISSFPMPR